MNDYFEPTGKGNEIMDCGDFYISYNREPLKGTILASDDESDETALSKDGNYYILNGDFRETYRELLHPGGWEECFEYYKILKEEFGSSWSSSLIGDPDRCG